MEQKTVYLDAKIDRFNSIKSYITRNEPVENLPNIEISLEDNLLINNQEPMSFSYGRTLSKDTVQSLYNYYFRDQKIKVGKCNEIILVSKIPVEQIISILKTYINNLSDSTKRNIKRNGISSDAKTKNGFPVGLLYDYLFNILQGSTLYNIMESDIELEAEFEFIFKDETSKINDGDEHIFDNNNFIKEHLFSQIRFIEYRPFSGQELIRDFNLAHRNQSKKGQGDVQAVGKNTASSQTKAPQSRGGGGGDSSKSRKGSVASSQTKVVQSRGGGGDKSKSRKGSGALSQTKAAQSRGGGGGGGGGGGAATAQDTTLTEFEDQQDCGSQIQKYYGILNQQRAVFRALNENFKLKKGDLGLTSLQKFYKRKGQSIKQLISRHTLPNDDIPIKSAKIVEYLEKLTSSLVERLSNIGLKYDEYHPIRSNFLDHLILELKDNVIQYLKQQTTKEKIEFLKSRAYTQFSAMDCQNIDYLFKNSTDYFK